jgi:antitoxin component YwqK of YwqJK toxin-antitoxin module
MIKLVSLSLVVFFISSCGTTTSEEKYMDCERLNYDPLYNHFYETDRDKPYTGSCKVFYPGGILQQSREIVDGKNHGEYKVYNEQGVLIEEGGFYENLHHGHFRYYNEHGELTDEIEYVHGRSVRKDMN